MPVTKFVGNLLGFLNDFNTTSGRIVSTIILAAVTAVRVLFLDKVFGPMDSGVLITWCTFLATLGGLDVIQFAKKRSSYIVPNGTQEVVTTAASISNRRTSGEHEGVEPTP